MARVDVKFVNDLGDSFVRAVHVTDERTGKKWHICGGFPSASGKTNLAMTLAPYASGDRYYLEFYGDDIAWLWAGDNGRFSTTLANAPHVA